MKKTTNKSERKRYDSLLTIQQRIRKAIEKDETRIVDKFQSLVFEICGFTGEIEKIFIKLNHLPQEELDIILKMLYPQ